MKKKEKNLLYTLIMAWFFLLLAIGIVLLAAGIQAGPLYAPGSASL